MNNILGWVLSFSDAKAKIFCAGEKIPESLLKCTWGPKAIWEPVYDKNHWGLQ